MTSVVDIWNQALGAVGAQSKLTDIEQNTREGEVCRLVYDDVLTLVFSAAYWSSLRATSVLTLVAERDFGLDWTEADPAPNFRFAYRLPTGHVYPRWVSGYIPFTLAVLGDETTLQTDAEEASLTYTVKIEDPDRWEPLLRSMVVAALADAISRPLRVSDEQYRRVALYFQQTYQSVMTMQANTESPYMIDSTPDWIAARSGGLVTARPLCFLYPPQMLVHGYGQI